MKNLIVFGILILAIIPTLGCVSSENMELNSSETIEELPSNQNIISKGDWSVKLSDVKHEDDVVILNFYLESLNEAKTFGDDSIFVRVYNSKTQLLYRFVPEYVHYSTYLLSEASATVPIWIGDSKEDMYAILYSPSVPLCATHEELFSKNETCISSPQGNTCYGFVDLEFLELQERDCIYSFKI